MKRKLFVFILFIFFVNHSNGQAIFENVQNSIYDYLSRQAQKGNILLDDMIRPLTRNQISSLLSELDQKKTSTLNRTEKLELQFFIQEYGKGVGNIQMTPSKEKWLQKDPRGRIRFFSMIDTSALSPSVKNKKNTPFQFNVEPVLQGSFKYGKDTQSIVTRTAGIQIWASLGQRWGFQTYFRDINEDGKGIDFDKNFTSEQGIVPTANPKSKALNYSDVRATMTYQWNSGLLSFGKEQYVAGYGLNGNIIYSTKSPSYPYLRFKQQVLPWLKFEYTHAFLASRLVDTPNSYRTTNYGVYGGQRFKMIPKYMVSHALNVRLKKGLELMFGESVIYSDKLQLGYWLPLMYFKAWDQYVSANNLNAGSNAQLFAQISSRDQIKNTHIYGSVFIDEFRPSAIFDPKRSRNQLAFNTGFSITDLPFLPYVTFNADYTRINPFVYQNLLPAQEYTNNGYMIGDWLGNNADRMILEIKYTPIPRLKLALSYQKIRKGTKGTTEQQYFQQPQPEFLFGLEQKQWNKKFNIMYEWKHNFYLYTRFELDEVKSYGPIFKTKSFNLIHTGFSLGL